MNGNPGQGQLGKHEHYEIRLKGHVDEHWCEWFDNLTSTLEGLEGLRAPDGSTLRVAGIDPTREPRRLRNLISDV